MAKLGIIVPVLNRPARVKPLVESFRASCAPSEACLYFVAQQNDRAEIDAIMDLPKNPSLVNGVVLLVVSRELRTWAKKVNEAFKATDEEWMMLCGDDIAFEPGWFARLSPFMESNVNVIGTRDVGQEEEMSAHPIVRRAYVEEFGATVDGGPGVVVHDGYDHNFPDTELVATAMMRKTYVQSRVEFEHLHPLNGKAKYDDTYRLGQLNFAKDKALYRERALRFGFGG